MAWDKPVKVGKTERFTLGLTRWLKGEALIQQTVTSCSTGLQIKSSGIDGNNVWFLAEGVTEGSAKVIISYATASRSDSYENEISVSAAISC